MRSLFGILLLAGVVALASCSEPTSTCDGDPCEDGVSFHLLGVVPDSFLVEVEFFRLTLTKNCPSGSCGDLVKLPGVTPNNFIVRVKWAGGEVESSIVGLQYETVGGGACGTCREATVELTLQGAAN
jgi:hypothetical protein